MIEANEQNFNGLISSGIVLVDFWGDGCAPCKMMMPMLEQLEAELGTTIVKINIMQNRGIISQFGLRSVPVFKLFKDGEEIKTHNGVMSYSELKAFVEE